MVDGNLPGGTGWKAGSAKPYEGDLLGARGNLGGVTPVFRAASKASKGFAPSISGKGFRAFACVAGRIERLRATNERTSRRLRRISGALPTWGWSIRQVVKHNYQENALSVPCERSRVFRFNITLPVTIAGLGVDGWLFPVGGACMGRIRRCKAVQKRHDKTVPVFGRLLQR
jgi:hypothetical protein